jgi:DNA-3-methyladenine glycosylase II
MRAGSAAVAADDSFQLVPVPPFRLDLTAWVLRRRPDNAVDRWDGAVYRRVLPFEEQPPVEIAISQSGTPAAARLRVTVRGGKRSEAVRRQVRAAAERLLGIRVKLGDFYRMAEGDELLRPLANRFCGFKPPRFLTPFEALVNAMACQQLTLTVGIRLLNRLAQAYGPALATNEGTVHAFPRPQDLAQADVEDLRKMGFSYQKARYITGLAQAVQQGRLDLDAMASIDDAEALSRLLELKGVGRWTAEYFLLRGLGRTHIFPGDDVGARNHLQRWLGRKQMRTYAEVHKALERWQGYGGLLYFHLLLKGLVEKGIIAA